MISLSRRRQLKIIMTPKTSLSTMITIEEEARISTHIVTSLTITRVLLTRY